MPRTYGPLGQLSPAAASLEDAYTVPPAKHATGKVIVCNRSSSPDTFRIALSPLGVAVADAQYIAYDQDLSANDSVASVSFTLGATDVVRVYSAAGFVSFTFDAIEDDN